MNFRNEHLLKKTKRCTTTKTNFLRRQTYKTKITKATTKELKNDGRTENQYRELYHFQGQNYKVYSVFTITNQTSKNI